MFCKPSGSDKSKVGFKQKFQVSRFKLGAASNAYRVTAAGPARQDTAALRWLELPADADAEGVRDVVAGEIVRGDLENVLRVREHVLRDGDFEAQARFDGGAAIDEVVADAGDGDEFEIVIGDAVFEREIAAVNDVER